MCTFCGQHCVEDEFYRLSSDEIKSGIKLPENTCPDKWDEVSFLKELKHKDKQEDK
tara:strand:+ start:370 stop:537 length:168 start_codon:yes stop_codon:yes gene_type:complete